jgi:hypothetical protein
LQAESASIRQDVVMRSLVLSKDIDALRASMTIRLGSMLVVGLGLLFAALNLT